MTTERIFFNGKQVGTYDHKQKTYYRSISRQQMFQHPKYEGMLAISENILKKLEEKGCQKIVFDINEWEKKPFQAIISLKKFIEEGEKLHFAGKKNSDKQKGVRLHKWTRKYYEQKTLT